EAYKQVMHLHKHLVFSVPSGNFGNLTAGLLAKKMGLPVSRFIAATNSNHIFPDFLNTGVYDPKPAIATISNAMDVGDPSNFVRIQDMYDRDLSAIQKDVSGFWLNDEETRAAMIDAFSKYNYVCDPHGAIAYKALESLSDDELGIFLETAHPCKFQDVVEDTLNHKMELSSDLLTLMTKTKNAVSMEADFSSFKSYLLSRQ
ncbi:MAG: threonine synthase, partial [Saprospiraceae bacterium]|nr:threonine synthase [Saprospiraceae bacterium]